MYTMDTVGLIVAGLTMIGCLIVVLKFVSDRPKREEVQQMISLNVKPIAEDVRYIRQRIDEMPVRKPK